MAKKNNSGPRVVTPPAKAPVKKGNPNPYKKPAQQGFSMDTSSIGQGKATQNYDRSPFDTFMRAIDPTGLSSVRKLVEENFSDKYEAPDAWESTADLIGSIPLGGVAAKGIGKVLLQEAARGVKPAIAMGSIGATYAAGKAGDWVEFGKGVYENNKKASPGKGKKSYLSGGSIKNPITNPLDALHENNMNRYKADAQASAGFLPQMLDLLGPIAAQMAGGLSSNYANRSPSVSPISMDLQGMQFPGATSPGNFPMFANGGETESNINAEGQELLETPDGEVVKLKGASHENGGIDLDVSAGSTIYSKRLKGADGRTYAARKESRVKELKRLETKLDKDPTNKLLADTYARTKNNFDMLDEKDTEEMNAANPDVDSFANGGTVPPFLQQLLFNGLNQEAQNRYNNEYLDLGEEIGLDGPMIASKRNAAVNPLDMPGAGYQGTTGAMPVGMPTSSIPNFPTQPVAATPAATPTEGDTSGGGLFDNLLGIATRGDAMGMLGNYQMGQRALQDAYGSANNIPNVNAFENFGREGLQANQAAQNQIAGQRDQSLRSIMDQAASRQTSSRNNARGVNQMRAGDLAVQQQADKQVTQTNQAYANQMMQALSQRSALLNSRDQAKMTAEDTKNVRNQEDLGALQSNVAGARQSESEGLVRRGAILNKMKERDLTLGLTNQLYSDFQVDADGNITGKGRTIPKGDVAALKHTGKLKDYQEAIDLGYDVDTKYGDIYYKGTETKFDKSNPDPNKMNLTTEASLEDLEADYQGSGFEDFSSEFDVPTEENNLPFTDDYLSGSKLYSGIKMDEIDGLLGTAASMYGQELNLDSVASVKEFQKDFLGMKEPDGKFGKETKEAIEKKLMGDTSTSTVEEAVAKSPKYFKGLTSSQTNSIKRDIMQAETSGGRDTGTSSAGAKGRYQIIWSHHGNNIKKTLGEGITEQQFFSNPQLQDQYMDLNLQQHSKWLDQDNRVSKIQQAIPDLSKEDMIKLRHLEPAILTGILNGTVKDKNHIPGTDKHINKSIGYYLNPNYRGVKTGKGSRKTKK